jgi:2-hydroxy-6-oxonona-2,4-dienedioate hydrolase
MGCMNTANYVVAHPDRILSYILIAGDLGDVLPPGLRPPAQSQLTRWDGTADGMRTMMTAIIYRNEAISDDLISMRTMSATSHADAHAHYWPSLLQFGRIVPWEDENLAARMSTKGRLDRMTLPALYLYGQQDVLTPVEWAYEQEKVLPNLPFFYPDECGHQGQTDQPDMFNQVFLEFFRDGKVTRKTAEWAGVSTRRAEIDTLVDKE